MAYAIVRTDAEIDDVIGKCMDAENECRSAYPGMTYEQGVNEALRWVTGEIDDNPMADEES